MVLNDKHVSRLRAADRIAGLDTFLSITPIGQRFDLPEHKPYLPNPAFLRAGLALRGFESV